MLKSIAKVSSGVPPLSTYATDVLLLTLGPGLRASYTKQPRAPNELYDDKELYDNKAVTIKNATATTTAAARM